MLKRLRQYDGKVDFVVTDAPLLMNHIYGTNESCEFHRLVDVEFNKYKNINFVVLRGDAPYTMMAVSTMKSNQTRFKATSNQCLKNMVLMHPLIISTKIQPITLFGIHSAF